MNYETKFHLAFAGDWRSIVSAVRSALGPDAYETHEALMDELHGSWSADDDEEEGSDGAASIVVTNTALLARLLPTLEAEAIAGHIGYSIVAVVKGDAVTTAARLSSAGWYGDRSGWTEATVKTEVVSGKLTAAARAAVETLNKALVAE